MPKNGLPANSGAGSSRTETAIQPSSSDEKSHFFLGAGQLGRAVRGRQGGISWWSGRSGAHTRLNRARNRKGLNVNEIPLTLTLIGGPTVLLEINGMRLLTDPTFDPPRSYDARDIVLTKQTGPALEAEAIGAVDAVLLSHDQHFDNLDDAGRAFLPRARRVLTTVAGAARLGGQVQGLEPWQGVDLLMADGLTLRVTATPARHGPAGIEPLSGDVIGFVLTIEGGPALYISGDTVWYHGVAEVARRFDVKAAILFTGAAQPRGSFHVTMDSNDAIEAAHAFLNATIFAIHNEGWAHLTESQEDLAKAFSVVGLGPRLRFLERGVPVSLTVD